MSRYEVRLDMNGELDELIADGTFHLERMGDNDWWIGITLPDGRNVHLRFGAMNNRAKFYMLAEEDWADGKDYRADFPSEQRSEPRK
jgi:hypothetical protein